MLGLILSLIAFGDVGAQPPPEKPEPPVRLKKKPKAPADEPGARPKPPAKPGTEKEEPEPELEPEIDVKEVLGRVSKNMRASEDKLSKKDPGEGTRQIQRDIVKDLDSLIEQTKRQQQQQQQQAQQNQDPNQQQKNQSARSKGQRRQQSPRAGQKPQQGSQPKGQMANQGGLGQRSKEELNRIADVYKDIWGHLPETLRAEMNQYSREQFMARYSDLLQQYYATIAEKGRRKGE